MATVSKFCNKIVAQQKGVRHELKAIADKGKARAQAILAGHDHPGGAEITVQRGTRIDYFWSLEDTDTGKGEPAAAAIEFGHTTPSGKPVEGLHVIKRSAR